MRLNIVILVMATLLFTSCVKNPQNPKLELPKKRVEKSIGEYSKSLDLFGEMTDVFDTKYLNIQSKGVVDDTGTAQATGGEIPVDITEMIKSAINSIGGRIRYVDYDPSHQINMMRLGYTKFKNKLIPNLVISGGITEFDRSLEVRGNNKNFDVDFNLGAEKVGIGYGDSDKKATSSITLDISLIDFQTWSMIPKMTAVNKVYVHSGLTSADIGFTIIGAAFGVNGNVKKVQGRHAATRLLVELSVIEVLGRYLNLPYWKILPNGKEDRVVVRNITNIYSNSSKKEKITILQKLLYLHGYDVNIGGVLDKKTKDGLIAYKKEHNFVGNNLLSIELFKNMYINVPIENNPRSISVFSGYMGKSVKQKQQQRVITDAKKIKKVSKVAEQQKPKTVKSLIAKGVFKSTNEALAINMATNLALNSLAKKFGKVIQSEYSNIINEDVMMKITTNAKNIITGYEIISLKYDPKTQKAEVIIELDGKVIDASVKKYR